MSEGAKYIALQDYLRSRPDEPIDVDVATVADLVGGLPESAYRPRAWWAKDATHVQAQAWLATGRRVDEVDLHSARVRFSASSMPQTPVSGRVDADTAEAPGTRMGLWLGSRDGKQAALSASLTAVGGAQKRAASVSCSQGRPLISGWRHSSF